MADTRTLGTTIYWGMNAAAHVEARALAAGSSRDGEVVVISAPGSSITIAGDTYDLSTAEGLDGFITNCGMAAPVAGSLRRLLGSTVAAKQASMAQLALLFARAEAGGRPIERLVLSAHHDGSRLWSDSSDAAWLTDGVHIASIRQLIELFPVASAGVHDVMLSACASGYLDASDAWRNTFPNLLSFTGYAGRSPSTANGAADALAIWARNTEPGDKPGLVEPQLFGSRPTRFDTRNATTWNISDGYHGPSYALASSTASRLMPRLAAYRAGTQAARGAPLDPQLTQLYYALQTMLHSKVLTDPTERERVRQDMLDTLVLRHPELGLPRMMGLL